MTTPYVGEIRMFAGNFAPQGWALCDGSLLAISTNEVLFILLGTTYGGDGASTFALPDLRGRAPVHQNAEWPIGMRTGNETVTLTVQNLPAHQHTVLYAVGGEPVASPAGALPAAGGPFLFARQSDGAAVATSTEGGSQPHQNMAPFLALNFIIALEGIFPSRS